MVLNVVERTQARPLTRLSTDPGSHLPAALERLGEGDLVGVLQVAPDRETARETGHSDAAARLEEGRDVHRRGVALEVRIGREDDLRDAVALDAFQELPHPEVVRPDPVERRDRAAEDVVPAPDDTRLLDGGRVLRLLDHADHVEVAALVSAHAAQLALRDVAAFAA